MDDRTEIIDHDVTLEAALLGAILMNNQAMAGLGDVKVEHFFEPVHQLIFQGCQALIEAGKEANPLTLRTILPTEFRVGEKNAAQYLASLASGATSVLLAKQYGDDMRAMWMIREGSSITDDARRFRQRRMFPSEAMREMVARLDLLRLDQPTQSVSETIEQSGEEFVAWMSGVMSGEIKQNGATTGLGAIDRMTGGIKGGDVVIVAGRPGMGKTTFGAGIARGSARGGNGTGMFSLEMTRQQLMARVHCDEALSAMNITYQKVLNPNALGLSVREAEEIIEAQRRLARLPLMFDFSPSLTVGEIAAKARGMDMVLKRKFKAPLRVLVIDYIKFIKSTDRYRGQRVYEIGEISASLKQLAKEMNVGIVLLAQLSRKVEDTEHKIPDLSHLRESGDLEADADLVLFLFRRAYYIQNNPASTTDLALQQELVETMNKILVIVAKNRHGPTGNVPLYCNMGASAIRDLHQEAPAQGEIAIT